MTEITPEDRVAALKFCSEPDCCGVWCPCRDKLVRAIREAENAAYERAAAEARKPKAGAYETRVIISKAIKALKHQSA